MEYLKYKSPSFMEAYKMAFINWFNFDDRSRRAEYWKFVAVYNLILLIVFIICINLDGYKILTGTISVIPVLAVILVHFIPSLSLLVRRIHDTGHSSKFILLLLLAPIPMIGYCISLGASIGVLICLLKDSDKENNGWGESPKYYTED